MFHKVQHTGMQSYAVFHFLRRVGYITIFSRLLVFEKDTDGAAVFDSAGDTLGNLGGGIESTSRI
jgi:hypothetical protein